MSIEYLSMNTQSSYPVIIDTLSHSLRERLMFIEFRLYFLGNVRRQDLIQRFGIAPAVATRDFAQYRDIFPDNISFDSKAKVYVIGDSFIPVFNHVPERVLIALSQGFGEGISGNSGSLLTSELPRVLNQPSIAILAPITRAIYQKRVLALSTLHIQVVNQRVN